VKSDRFDAATLARLLAADMIDGVWVPDEQIGALRRRIARRAALVRQRTRAKNEVHAVIMRCLLGRPPASDLFGIKGRAWLASQQLPPAEQETAAGCLRQIDFLDAEIAMIDAKLAALALESPDARRLMTIPGVDVAAACTLIATIGDIRRFDSPRKLAAYLGLDPRVRQSGEKPARYGAISKRGNPHARHVLVEAGWQAMRTPGRAVRLRRTDPSAQRLPGRSRRRGAQDRHDRLADAPPRRRLRLPEPLARPQEAAQRRAHERRPQTPHPPLRRRRPRQARRTPA